MGSTNNWINKALKDYKMSCIDDEVEKRLKHCRIKLNCDFVLDKIGLYIRISLLCKDHNNKSDNFRYYN